MQGSLLRACCESYLRIRPWTLPPWPCKFCLKFARQCCASKWHINEYARVDSHMHYYLNYIPPSLALVLPCHAVSLACSQCVEMRLSRRIQGAWDVSPRLNCRRRTLMMAWRWRPNWPLDKMRINKIVARDVISKSLPIPDPVLTSHQKILHSLCLIQREKRAKVPPPPPPLPNPPFLIFPALALVYLQQLICPVHFLIRQTW